MSPRHRAVDWEADLWTVLSTPLTGLMDDMMLCGPQEHLNYVTEISQDELFILDPELVLKETVGTSPGMPDLVDSYGEAQADAQQFAFPSSSSSPISSPGPR